MDAQDMQDLFEGELIIVRHSGEIPEIALYGSIYYLQDDPEGPRMRLEPEQIERLRDAAAARFAEIVLRDMDPDNRGKSIYRGLARSMANWERFRKFCGRAGRSPEPLRPRAARALCAFLAHLLAERAAGISPEPLNCQAREVEDFARQLGLSPADLPGGWQVLCPGDGH